MMGYLCLKLKLLYLLNLGELKLVSMIKIKLLIGKKYKKWGLILMELKLIKRLLIRKLWIPKLILKKLIKSPRIRNAAIILITIIINPKLILNLSKELLKS